MPASAYKMSSRNRTRRAFSLAEIMIAIGILGVGMLMVAATFPVGLDQSRIVTEQTIAPLVANDAFERLRLLLAEPDSIKRIPVDESSIVPADPSQWRSFRGSLALVPANSAVRYRLPGDLSVATTCLGLNDLLTSPYLPARRGAGTGFYPSIAASWDAGAKRWMLPLRTDPSGQPQRVEPPYTWSALYRKYAIADQTYVQFFVFVNRGAAEWPASAGVDTIAFPIPTAWDAANDPVVPGPLLDAYNDKIPMSKFSEGAFLVSSQGNILRIKEVNRRDNTITLDRAPDDSIFWFIEADPATGQSPCIGVYSRTFPL